MHEILTHPAVLLTGVGTGKEIVHTHDEQADSSQTEIPERTLSPYNSPWAMLDYSRDKSGNKFIRVAFAGDDFLQNNKIPSKIKNAAPQGKPSA